MHGGVRTLASNGKKSLSFARERLLAASRKRFELLGEAAIKRL
jgi:hypothetical protein